MTDLDASKPELDASSRDASARPDSTVAPDAAGDAALDAGVAIDGAVDAAVDAGVDAAVDATVAKLNDPGKGPWQLVPDDQVLATCKLDPALLAEADRSLNAAWAVVRYGKLCHAYVPNETAGPAWSATKTLGALVTGMVSYETRGIAKAGAKTGPFSDEDRVDAWIEDFSYNPDAHVAHVLAMVAHNEDLSFGKKEMVYDTVGTTQINTLSDMLNVAIKQDTRLGGDLEKFTQNFLFSKLGTTDSSWSDNAPDKVFAYSWTTKVHDMARLGLLMLNGGMWSNERLLASEWIYRMTHPAFEDSNSAYGYLTWLNAGNNYSTGGIPGAPAPDGPALPGPCAPLVRYNKHPHGLSDAPNCGFTAPYSCDQEFDVGVWQAVGLGGQVIQGHPGLDMVVVGRDLTPFDTGPNAPPKLWDALLPAVIAGDPKYKGDHDGFCAAYGGNHYAPDWTHAY